jgi:hypothetical protein
MSTEEALLAATRNGAELTAREFRNYAALIDFFILHLDGYAYDNLSPFERSAGSVRSTPAMRPLFGLDKIPGEVGLFVSYFMISKVVAAKTVTTTTGS